MRSRWQTRRRAATPVGSVLPNAPRRNGQPGCAVRLSTSVVVANQNPPVSAVDVVAAAIRIGAAVAVAAVTIICITSPVPMASIMAIAIPSRVAATATRTARMPRETGRPTAAKVCRRPTPPNVWKRTTMAQVRRRTAEARVRRKTAEPRVRKTTQRRMRKTTHWGRRRTERARRIWREYCSAEHRGRRKGHKDLPQHRVSPFDLDAGVSTPGMISEYRRAGPGTNASIVTTLLSFQKV